MKSFFISLVMALSDTIGMVRGKNAKYRQLEIVSADAKYLDYCVLNSREGMNG